MLNYNTFIIPGKLPKPLDKPMNKRAKLDTGKFCNYDCYFCYYQGHLDECDTYEEIIERADKLKALGMEEIDLSGGESSIHPRFFDILDYCNKNFKNVSCLSNGSKFSNFDFLKKAKDHGLSEILFSLHGLEKYHEKSTRIKGSYNKIIKAINNAKKLNMCVRINCTVTSENMDNLKEYAKKIVEIKPYQINFLPLNYWDSANDLEIEDYSILSNKIKEAIDIIKSKGIEINVRYIPFCFMIGYEEYVKDIFQHIYDLKDWNIAAYDYEKPDYIFEIAKNKIILSYFKPSICKDCKYFFECDGIEHKYKKIAHKILKPILKEES